MRALTSLALGAILVGGSGCSMTLNAFQNIPAIQGSGVLKEEPREVTDFQALSVNGVIKATVSVGPKATVTLKGDDNILPLIVTEVKDGTLSIYQKDNTCTSTKLPLEAIVTAPKLVAVKADGASSVQGTVAGSDTFRADAQGAAHVTLDGINAADVDLLAAGASHLTVAGKAKQVKLHASGATHVAADKLDVEQADVHADGAAHAAVKASASVQGAASGAAHVTVHGKPGSKTVTTSGAAHVQDE